MRYVAASAQRTVHEHILMLGNVHRAATLSMMVCHRFSGK